MPSMNTGSTNFKLSNFTLHHVNRNRFYDYLLPESQISIWQCKFVRRQSTGGSLFHEHGLLWSGAICKQLTPVVRRFLLVEQTTLASNRRTLINTQDKTLSKLELFT